jgi:hypothetical protein
MAILQTQRNLLILPKKWHSTDPFLLLYLLCGVKTAAIHVTVYCTSLLEAMLTENIQIICKVIEKGKVILESKFCHKFLN